MSNPYNPQQYPGHQPGQYPNSGYHPGLQPPQGVPPTASYGQPSPGTPSHMAPGRGLGINFGALDTAKLGAIVTVAAGLLALLGSLLSLYSVTVTPSAANVPDNDAPAGQIHVGIGFYDVVPVFAPPIVAQAVPVLLALAALCVAPVIFGADRRTAPLAAVFAGTGALLALMLTISSPLPSVQVTGQMAVKLGEEIGGQTIDQLVDSVASVRPGAGLIITLLFGLVAWAAAAVTAFNRNPSAPQPGPAGGGSVPPVQPRW